MKQIVKLLPSLLKRENPSRVISILEEKKHPFIVLVTEVNNQHLFFLKQVIKNLDLVQGKGHGKLKSVKKGDVIVFGDANIYSDYDFRIISSVNDYEEIEGLDERKYQVYDLLEDFKIILGKLYKYAKANYQQSFLGDSDYYDPFVELRQSKKYVPVRSYIRRKPKKRKFGTIRVRLNVSNDNSSVKKRYLNYVDAPPLVNNNYFGEKVDINHNWVRIGWNQYDIECDRKTGEESITLGNGDTLFIEEDRHGRKYLTR